MTTEDRRAFLRKLAKGAAYSAPVVYSMAAPLDLVGQGKSSEHKHEHEQGHDSGDPALPTSPFPPPPGG